MTQLSDSLNEVLLQQTEYSRNATPAMRERKSALEEATVELRKALNSTTWASRLQVDCRDGTGGKSRVPWIRVYDASASPSPTAGWYVVFLFAANGECVYLSLNQGTSEWVGKNVVREPLEIIEHRTLSARALLLAQGVLPSDICAAIDLGERGGPLAQGYESGNVAAFRYEFGFFAKTDEIVECIRVLELARARIDGHSPGFLPGIPYRESSALQSVEELEAKAFVRDPAKLGWALRVHRETQHLLSQMISRAGHQPLLSVDEPRYDIGWLCKGTFFLVEVKSLPEGSEVSQLRLGLGQLLHYRQLLELRYPMVQVLLILALNSVPPTPWLWTSIGHRSGIEVTWGPDWSGLTGLLAEPTHEDGPEVR